MERVKLRALNKQISGNSSRIDHLQQEIGKITARLEAVSEDLNKKKVTFSDTIEAQEKTQERLDVLEEFCNDKKFKDIERTVQKLIDKSINTVNLKTEQIVQDKFDKALAKDESKLKSKFKEVSESVIQLREQFDALKAQVANPQKPQDEKESEASSSNQSKQPSILGSRNSSHLQSPAHLLVSLNLGFSQLAINKAVEVKEISNDKGNQRFIKISIPREVVKSVAAAAPKVVARPLIESDSDSDEKDDRALIDVDRKAAKKRTDESESDDDRRVMKHPKAQKTPTKYAKQQPKPGHFS